MSQHRSSAIGRRKLTRSVPLSLDVVFVNQSASADLAYVNDAGNVIIKVDNTSVVPYNEKRNTVKITTEDTVSSPSQPRPAPFRLGRGEVAAEVAAYQDCTKTSLG